MTTGMGRFLLIPGILLGLTALSSAAPATYDQRQDGKTNLQTNLENVLFVIGTAGYSDMIGELAVEALALAARSKQKSAAQQPVGQSNFGSPEPEAVVYETEEVNVGKEPYRVEIVRIEKEGGPEKLVEPVKVNDPRESEESEVKSLEVEPEKLKVKELKSDDEEKTGRSVWRTGSRKLEESLEKQEDVERVASQMESLENKEEIPKSGKPGLNNQLPKKELNAYLSLDEMNDVPSHEGKPEELKLLGDAIENCGPGRFRDNSGVCQTDKSVATK